MTERFLPGAEPPKQKQMDELRAHVAGELERAAWLPGAGERLVGIGGTVRNLAAAAQRAAGMPSNGVQGVKISEEALERLVERLAELPAAQRSRVPGIKPARADLILAGAVVVQEALRTGGFEELGEHRGGPARGGLLRAASRRSPTLRCSRTSGARA